jgi:hypothetical protein
MPKVYSASSDVRKMESGPASGQEMKCFNETRFACAISRLLTTCAFGFLCQQHVQTRLQIAEILEGGQRAE